MKHADYLEITAIYAQARQGTTRPFICQANNHQTYFAKGKATGIAGLIKEWVGAHLGQAFGLPIPDFGIALAAENLLLTHGSNAMDSLGIEPLFVSKSIDPAQELNYSLVGNVELQLQQEVLIFDAWVGHNDRTLSELGGNPNLIWAASELYVIDHNLIFADDFSITDLYETHVFRQQLNSIIGDYLLRDHFQQKMQAALRDWSVWWDALPEEWCDINSDLGLLDQDEIYQRLQQDAQGAIWARLNT